MRAIDADAVPQEFLTDGEYYRIANKLNEKWGKTELPEPYKGVTT